MPLIELSMHLTECNPGHISKLGQLPGQIFISDLPKDKRWTLFLLVAFVFKMISAQHSSNNGKNWQKLSYQKILLAQ